MRLLRDYERLEKFVEMFDTSCLSRSGLRSSVPKVEAVDGGEPRSTTDRQSLSVAASTECRETKLALSRHLAAGCRESRAILDSGGGHAVRQAGDRCTPSPSFFILNLLWLL